jgi:hypothetical protein
MTNGADSDEATSTGVHDQPARAKMMGISFVKLFLKRERKPHIFAQCVVLIFVP